MKPLQTGDTIGIVSPASRPQDELYDQTQNFFEARGFRVKVFAELGERFGRMAGSDASRARNLEQAFRDPEVAMILCTRGGYGSGRLLDELDYDLVARSDKALIGYSDITNLLISTSRNSGLRPFHGPMATDLVGKRDAWSTEHFFDVLMGRTASYTLGTSDFGPIREGRAKGRLFGGNITIIESLLGTSDLTAKEPRILFLEDVGEFMFRLDRSLVHLKRAGFFENVVGIVFGDLKLSDRGADNSLGIGFEELLHMHFADFPGPIAIDLPCAHTQRQMTLPIGAAASLTVGQDELTLSFSDFWQPRSRAAIAA
jgi:muramoyltetrapeptide carboxypeptidase